MTTLQARMKDYQRRVDLAENLLLQKSAGNQCGRELDNCFEQYDGEFVVTALIRRAEKSDELTNALKKDLTPRGWEKWNRIAAKNRHVSDDGLAKIAATIQREAEWNSVHIFIPQLEKANDPQCRPFKICRTSADETLTETFHARNLREVTQEILKNWQERTVQGAPYVDMLTTITITTPDGEQFEL